MKLLGDDKVQGPVLNVGNSTWEGTEEKACYQSGGYVGY